MTQLIPIDPGLLQLGRPMQVCLYDRHGTLVIKDGYAIRIQRYLDLLVAHGLYYEKSDEPAVIKWKAAPMPLLSREQVRHNSFADVDMIKLRLARLQEQYRNGVSNREDFLRRVQLLALEIQDALDHDADACLASLHLDVESPYEVLHHLQAALICEILGRRLGVPEEPRLSLVQAALTHDIGVTDVQFQLEREEALSPELRERVRRHPEDGVRLLRALGVSDRTWLEAVAHHHERLDGQGYPQGLRGEQVPVSSRVLMIADIYSAMIQDRPYRKAIFSREALRQLFVDMEQQCDQRLTQLLIKEIGIFPPGAVVRLANGEVAVVAERRDNSASPLVYTFLNAQGLPTLAPMRRETNRKEAAVQSMASIRAYPACLRMVRSIWLQEGRAS
ncbi:HD-GYP domain-containing protein [Azovibrio restrictus]|uniref:HD-GYP domain-containing protein n=1 Tax=Azovibrio restrictus TaxID=146938 RepID=UPI0026F00A93|nr:HD domain-containing phosphohydrolase [Azovibrio restrictus]MDD3482726.1 HD domain-containing protein [Azovibrio restrictus]